MAGDRRKWYEDMMNRARAQDPIEQERERAEREKKKEKEKAQRILMRQLRAGSGGYFESDADTLGGSGFLG